MREAGSRNRVFRPLLSLHDYCARGYPPSDVPPTIAAYSQDRAAEDIADVVRAVANGPAHIVGLSMGGFAALHFALRHPISRGRSSSRASATAPSPNSSRVWASMPWKADHAESIGMAAFARELYGKRLRAMPARPRTRRAGVALPDELAEHSVTRHGDDLARHPRHAAFAMASRGRAARTLNVPILLVAGDEDTPCLEPNLFSKATLPDAALCVFRAAGTCSISKSRRCSTRSFSGS